MEDSVTALLEEAKQASRPLGTLSTEARRSILRGMADAIRKATPGLLKANRPDVESLPIDDPRRDRLALTEARIEDVANGIEAVAALPDPLWETLEERAMPSGIHVRRVRVPLGSIGCIYEARPNVTADIAALCLMTGNAAVLKGGHEAHRTNEAMVTAIRNALRNAGLPEASVTLLPPDRAAANTLMTARGLIDVLIPRGSAGLIRAVREQATVPIIETGAGVCHIYVHEDADIELAARVVTNAKTRRVSVCNALDCLLVHDSLKDRLEEILAPCRAKGVTVHDNPATAGREWLSMQMTVLTVSSLDAALDHIAHFGSGHSESIVTRSPEAAARFQREVDAACVYVNTPTSFTDGGCFGLGAEVGISTQKLHARGPMGLTALTTCKWLIDSDGALRP